MSKGTEYWRLNAERFLKTTMSVEQWCKLNHVSRSGLYANLSHFATTEPELFGGAGNIADRSKRKWLTNTRNNMRASTALAPTKESGFVEINLASLVDECHPAEKHIAQRNTASQLRPVRKKSIVININSANIEIPSGPMLQTLKRS